VAKHRSLVVAGLLMMLMVCVIVALTVLVHVLVLVDVLFLVAVRVRVAVLVALLLTVSVLVLLWLRGLFLPLWARLRARSGQQPCHDNRDRVHVVRSAGRNIAAECTRSRERGQSRFARYSPASLSTKG
jgi:hypothetical protein